MKIAALVLAAGAGRRMGGPKALVHDPDGIPWVVRTARLLTTAGCSPVLVVIGAEADQVAAALTAEPVEVVVAGDWQKGMGASLRAGLRQVQLGGDELGSVLVAPVDVPGLTADVVRRVSAQAGEQALVRAVYYGKPGHPVLLGREHWDGVIASAAGDEGARAYLKQHRAVEIECSDLADGADVDTREDLPPGHRLG
ncbi:nicotine blue oxidoreductase [Kribbella antiqua]|uniref:Nicotine blue oxidoreductase n=1 Tax=Kribbella antiqua TaxID=2512217 RepID=A0A4V2S5G3_9ACTN|nr:nucleotidyltransferase family protein [Kribbella antiqua]TCO52040.1 nicotine blue oxidoreductase [Kribbella antiqua]